MANIKISELDELQKATDQDLLVIVDVANNETKKIQAGNLGTGGAEIPIGPTPPENPKDGDFWIDTSANGETYGDTLPIGAMVEYNGTTVPQGYEKVSDGNIVESGSNYIKFYDGTLVCWGSKNVTSNITTAYGNMYRGTSAVSFENYQKPFISIPTVIVYVNGDNSSLIMNWTERTLNNPGEQMLVLPISKEGQTYVISYIAIGKWK